MYKPVAVNVSQKQLSKLRNGHRVRVKPPMEGEGICMVVNPENYSIISRTFSKGKGSEISLTPEEIMANRNLSPEDHKKMAESMGMMTGKGIFGKAFDRALAKVVGKNARREIYKALEEYKPLVKGAITTGLTAGATTLGASNPALIPYLPMGVGTLSSLAYDYLDRPSYYQGETRKKASSGEVMKNQLQAQQLEEVQRRRMMGMGMCGSGMCGSGMCDCGRCPNCMMGMYGSGLGLGLYTGSGLYASGSGLYASGDSRTGGQIGLKTRNLPPALQSQPQGANFQFQHFFPPQYAKLKR